MSKRDCRKTGTAAGMSAVRQSLMTAAELAPRRVKDFHIPRSWHEKCRPHWHSSQQTQVRLDTMKADAQGQGVIVPHKLREFITNLAAMLPGETSDGGRATKEQIQQLAGTITEHGRMLSRLYSRQQVGLEERELAFRFRETTDNIVSALVLLEKEGRASRSRRAGCWTLRVQLQNNKKEVFTSHEDQGSV
jgi:hypothetical protein